MPAEKRLPHFIVVGVLILTMMPIFLSALGLDFTCAHPDEYIVSPESTDQSQTTILFSKMSGPFWHTILEWTSFTTAFFCSILSLIHYRLKRDVTTPIIGIALFCSGMLDAFSTMAANRLFFTVPEPNDFFPFTWAVSRTFNVTILMAGTLPFLFGKVDLFSKKRLSSEIMYFTLIGLLFVVMAYATIHIFAVIIQPPQAIYVNTNSIFVRPWDAIPLTLMLVAAGIVFPRFSHLHPGVFSHSLIISMIPAIAAQTLLLFGSKQLYDANFNIAYYLKILAYAVPLCGLLIDYTRAYNSEVILKMTKSKLEAARQIQQQLLPLKSPEFDGFDISGCSFASEAVGGDYFDYLKFPNGDLGLVVADVSGHDIGASLFMTQVRAYLRALVRTAESPHEVVTLVNELLGQDTGDVRFVTFFMIMVNQEQHQFEYISAGHQAFILYKDGRFEEMVSSNPPLGLGIDDQQIVTSVSPIIGIDEFIIIPTDGIMEATSPTGQQYGIQKMMQLIHMHRHLPIQEIVSTIYQDVCSYTKKDYQSDDLTILIAKKCSQHAGPKMQSTLLAKANTGTLKPHHVDPPKSGIVKPSANLKRKQRKHK